FKDLTSLALKLTALSPFRLEAWPSAVPVDNSQLILLRAGDFEPILDAEKAGSYAIRCYGDGSLSKHPKQAALIAIYEARSVLDILESHRLMAKKNSFGDYRWKTA